MAILHTAELQRELADIAERLRASTVVVRSARGRRSRGGHGSGIVWSADGLVVTNAHVATEPRALVELADGRTLSATRVLHDPAYDLAVLRAHVDDAPLVPATRGDPTTLRPGALVLAHGHPLGITHALAVGVVHTIGRASWQRGTRHAATLIHTDLRLAPGNSGGPLVDARGHVVGVNAMIAGGLGVAVSIREVDALYPRAAPRPRLGATLRAVTVRRHGAESVGLLVLERDATGAAARAGLLAGDVLLGHAGRPFASPEDLVALLRAAGAGATLRLDVGRAGKQTSVVVELGDVVDPLARAA